MNTASLIKVCRVAKLVAAVFVLSVSLAIPARAQRASASVPQFEAAAEYSYVRANPDNANGGFNLNGGSGSFVYNFSDQFSAVADFGGYRFGGLPAGVDSKMFTYLFGPRYSFRSSARFTPFAQVLLGGGRLNASSGGVNAGENGFAMTMGGGLDVHFHSHFDIRVIQAEYLLTRFSNVSGASATQNDLRLSAGIVFHFGRR
jgi:hypothetical protein